MKAKVSIIIPVYNVERYLAECIESAIAQDYDNTEIILIDDGSTDGSGGIARDYSRRYPALIRCHQQRNQGLSCARNSGLRASSGDYILFLDSDDRIEPHTVSRCLSLAETENLDIVLFSAKAFADDTGQDVFKNANYNRPATLCDKVMPSVEFFNACIAINGFNPSACLYLYRRSSYESLSFFPGIIHEDELFTAKLLLHKKDARIMAIADVLFHRRLRANSIMMSAIKPANIEGLLRVVGELLAVLNAPGERNHFLRLRCQWLLHQITVRAPRAYNAKVPCAVRLRILRLQVAVDRGRTSPQRLAAILFAPYFQSKIVAPYTAHRTADSKFKNGNPT